jgi:hypothetical protein
MKARIKLTPALLRRLMDGKPLQFKFPKAATEVEIAIEEDIFNKFDRVFDKLWNKVLDKIGKIAE